VHGALFELLRRDWSEEAVWRHLGAIAEPTADDSLRRHRASATAAYGNPGNQTHVAERPVAKCRQVDETG